MDFKHDLAEISRQELHKEGIKVPKEWDDYRICMKYLELHHRWFDSSVAYISVFSRELGRNCRFWLVRNRRRSATLWIVWKHANHLRPTWVGISMPFLWRSRIFFWRTGTSTIYTWKRPRNGTQIPTCCFSSLRDKSYILLMCGPIQRAQSGLTGDCSISSMIIGPICWFINLVSDQRSLSLMRVSTNFWKPRLP